MNLLKNKKAVVIIGGILCGFFLLFFGGRAEYKTSDDVNNELYSNEELSVYTETLEKRVEAIISNIDGVSGVDVLITFESSNESVYASGSSNRDFVIIQNSDGSESGVKLMEINARVRGVAVVCDYGENDIMKKEIIDMLASLFDIGVNRIAVLQAK